MGVNKHSIINISRQLVLISLVYAILIQPVVEIFTLDDDQYELLTFVDDEKSEDEEKKENETNEKNDEAKFFVALNQFHFHLSKKTVSYQQNLILNFELEPPFLPPEQV